MSDFDLIQRPMEKSWNAAMRSMIFLFCAFVAMNATAQEQQQDTTTVKKEKKEKKEKKLYLWGFISDSFTKAYVPDVKVVVLRADSSLVDSAEVSNGYGSFKSTEYYLQVPAKPAKYIIKATHPDYETAYKAYEIKYVARILTMRQPTKHTKSSMWRATATLRCQPSA